MRFILALRTGAAHMKGEWVPQRCVSRRGVTIDGFLQKKLKSVSTSRKPAPLRESLLVYEGIF